MIDFVKRELFPGIILVAILMFGCLLVVSAINQEGVLDTLQNIVAMSPDRYVGVTEWAQTIKEIGK